LTVRIQNEWGYDLPDNAIGEVVLSGDFLFEGYFNDPETTSAHLANGHYKTRDRGFMRDGELYVLGRNDDLIIVNGRNLYAHEVEALVSGVQGIRPGRAVAFGTFNSLLGSQELIVVAEREHATSAISGQSLGLAVRDAVYDNTGIEIRSTYIVDPGWLVKTTSGKISREENQAKYLRESETTIVRSSEAFPLTGDTLDTLARIIEKEFDYPAQRVQRSTVANDVEGWDSLAHASLILTVEKMFGIHFVDSEIFSLSCVGDLADRCDWLIANSDTSSQKEERTIYESKHASILRMGQRQPSHTHDIIVFAGIAKKFAGTGLLDFASTFLETEARDTCKYFVTDHVKDWYVSCFDEVAAKLNQLSNSPKIFIGNSMGGYASLKFAEAVMNVIAVLAFVPHSIANPSNIKADSSEKWKVNFVPGVRYCILYGENEDAVHREYIQRQVSDKSRQRIVIVPGCGHMLVPYLNQRKFLAPILESCMRPETMGDDVEEIVSRMIKARKL
jgi:acyl carrier protein/predicted alpha/beta hydrolase family esterase